MRSNKEILLAAADIIEHEGLRKGSLFNPDGCGVCVLGALMLAGADKTATAEGFDIMHDMAVVAKESDYIDMLRYTNSLNAANILADAIGWTSGEYLWAWNDSSAEPVTQTDIVTKIREVANALES